MVREFHDPGQLADLVEHEIDGMITPDDQTLRLVGEHAAEAVIVLRTKQGLDADRRPFTAYSDAYKAAREATGRSGTTVDLAISGHMQQAVTVVEVSDQEVTLGFMNAHEEAKAYYHHNGVDKPNTYVKSHRRKTNVDIKTGRRVSAAEVRKDKKRKNKRTAEREEAVDSYVRHQRTPKREWFDIRHPAEVRVLEDYAADLLESRARARGDAE